jgi:hypothetical protein
MGIDMYHLLNRVFMYIGSPQPFRQFSFIGLPIKPLYLLECIGYHHDCRILKVLIFIQVSSILTKVFLYRKGIRTCLKNLPMKSWSNEFRN